MLTNSRTYSGLAVRGLEAARRFHADTLVYEQADAVTASFTILNFEVDDIEAEVSALAARALRAV